jgi:hypothetical protein
MVAVWAVEVGGHGRERAGVAVEAEDVIDLDQGDPVITLNGKLIPPDGSPRLSRMTAPPSSTFTGCSDGRPWPMAPMSEPSTRPHGTGQQARAASTRAVRHGHI